MKRFIVIALVFCLAQTCFSSSDINLNNRVKLTMKKAAAYFSSISTNGGYVGIYSLDLKERYGEAFYEKAKDSEIWVQPPGTPSIGQCFLRAYLITDDKEYLIAAREAGRALAWGQSKQGGWDHRVDVSKLISTSVKPERKDRNNTFDDNITQGALTFLINLDEVLQEEWLTESITLGINFIFESQFHNGAWPQWYPLIGGYHDCYTFNDNSINDCIRVMLLAHKKYGKEKYLESALRGGDFIINSQIAEPQSGWAQQYSHDMKIVWARAFEPPAVCSVVTARNIRTLVELNLYTKDVKFLAPIPSAIKWLESSKLDDNLWARLYELGSNRPIYGDRDSKIHFTLEEISEERREGYSWQSGFGVKSVIFFYNKVKEMGTDAYIAWQSKPLTEEQRIQLLKSQAASIKQLIVNLDEQGRWVNFKDNMIYAREFVRNFNILCKYLEIGISK